MTRQRAIAARFHRFSAQGGANRRGSRHHPCSPHLLEIMPHEILDVDADAVSAEWVADTLVPHLAALPDNARLLIRVNTDATFGAADFRSGVFAGAVRQNIIESVAHVRAPMASHNQALLVFGQPRPAEIDPMLIPLEAFRRTGDLLAGRGVGLARPHRRQPPPWPRQWMEDFRAGRVVATPEEARKSNQFQTPYAGLSKGQVPNLMVPSALADATTEALQNLAGRVGDVDEFVARESASHDAVAGTLHRPADRCGGPEYGCPRPQPRLSAGGSMGLAKPCPLAAMPAVPSIRGIR